MFRASNCEVRKSVCVPAPGCKPPKGLARETGLVIGDGGACTSRDCTENARFGMEILLQAWGHNEALGDKGCESRKEAGLNPRAKRESLFFILRLGSSKGPAGTVKPEKPILKLNRQLD